MSEKVQILCESNGADLEKAIESLLNKGWRIVNAFYRAGKMYGWCALMVKEDDHATPD